MQSGVQRQSSLKEKFKTSMCCFTGTLHHDSLDHGEYNKLNITTGTRSPKTPGSSPPGGLSSLLKKSSPSSCEYGGIRHSLRTRMGRKLHHHHHRQTQSADFSYDPSSYALNFENEGPEESSFRNFSSRLPASPPSSSKALKYSDDLAVPSLLPKKIVGYS